MGSGNQVGIYESELQLATLAARRPLVINAGLILVTPITGLFWLWRAPLSRLAGFVPKQIRRFFLGVAWDTFKADCKQAYSRIRVQCRSKWIVHRLKKSPPHTEVIGLKLRSSRNTYSYFHLGIKKLEVRLIVWPDVSAFQPYYVILV